jgi:hypothetical protein
MFPKSINTNTITLAHDLSLRQSQILQNLKYIVYLEKRTYKHNNNNNEKLRLDCFGTGKAWGQNTVQLLFNSFVFDFHLLVYKQDKSACTS